MPPWKPTADAGDGPAILALRQLLLAGEQFRHAVAEHFDVGVSESVALSHLHSGALTPMELTDRLGLTKSALTSVIDRLEGAGLARRQAHPTDRRRALVVITDRGQGYLDWSRDRLREVVTATGTDRLDPIAPVLADLAEQLCAVIERIKALPPDPLAEPAAERSAAGGGTDR